jgi:signal transduction histidine kinase
VAERRSGIPARKPAGTRPGPAPAGDGRRLDELARRERELAILAAVASRIHGELDTARVLDAALDEILGGLGLKTGWIFLGSERDHVLRLAAGRGLSREFMESVQRSGLGECLCPEVFTRGRAMQPRNTTECPRMPQIAEGLTQPVAHACIPLQFEGDVKGVLNVAAPEGELFTDRELSFLETVGHQIGLAFERIRHYESEQKRNREARSMAAITRAIGRSLDLSAVLTAVGETARELVGADRVVILLGSDPRDLTVSHLSGLPHPTLRQGQRLDLVGAGSRLQVRALETLGSVTSDDLEEDPRAGSRLARHWDAGSGMSVPLRIRGQAQGLITLTRRGRHHWTEDQVDVTEALAAHAAVALENARLYEEARQAYEELKKAQARIIQTEKMAVLGTFASGLAHEVRNPLNSIALQLSLMERRTASLEAAVASQVRDRVTIIREEVRRLDRLVSDFLMFSGQKRLHDHPVDLSRLLDDVIQLLQPEARSAQVVLRHESGAPAPPPLLADGERLKQVVINLVRNAIEAMPEGGEVVVADSVDDGRAVLSVRDNGPGLAEGIDVFELFVTTKPKGTGLGLPIAQQIVAEHGGDLTVESAPGRGAVFSVSLPLSAPSAKGGASAPRQKEGPP